MKNNITSIFYGCLSHGDLKRFFFFYNVKWHRKTVSLHNYEWRIKVTFWSQGLSFDLFVLSSTWLRSDSCGRKWSRGIPMSMSCFHRISIKSASCRWNRREKLAPYKSLIKEFIHCQSLGTHKDSDNAGQQTRRSQYTEREVPRY